MALYDRKLKTKHLIKKELCVMICFKIRKRLLHAGSALFNVEKGLRD